MPAKQEIIPLHMMAIAVREMKRSLVEKRKDGKKCPAVGSVLVKPDGEVETAYRGELRDGDHAEFTLLERKNRSNPLDGCMLFVTLEPCAPGARNQPKLSCAERIVLARIKKVWVGIEDPDPTVDRKGIKYLQDNGVDVQMFDSTFQSEIRAYNKEFIDQALERAVTAEEEKQIPLTLSPLEDSAVNTSLKELSMSAMNQYREKAKIEEEVNSEEFQARLVRQGLAKQDGKRFMPTGFGFLLFGKSPREVMPQAGLLGTIHYPNGKEETYDFDGPLVQIPGDVEKWLRDKMPNTIRRDQMERIRVSELPFELIREGVVNALVHRNYEIEGAKCQLVVTPEVVIVRSPGAPIEPITLQQLQEFNAPMLSRNPILHYIFAKIDLAEERGLGLRTMRSRAVAAGLPPPKYSWQAPYLSLTLYRSAASAAGDVAEGILGSLSRSERSGWEWLATKIAVNSNEYAAARGVPNRTALNHLKHFAGLGILRKIGSGPSTRYEVIRS